MKGIPLRTALSLHCARPPAHGLPLLIGIFLLTGASSGQEPGRAVGTVYLRAGDTRSPLARVYVTARAVKGGPLLASFRTNRDGRYSLADLPRRRVVLSALRPGYYVQLSRGRNGSEIVLDCTSGCIETGLDFELVRGSVIAGRVVDTLGEPVGKAYVGARERGKTGQDFDSRGVTDDRGLFRLAGLREGAYDLIVKGRPAGAPQQLRAIDVHLAQGEQVDGLTITFGGQPSYRVSGTVSGLNLKKHDQLRVSLQSLLDSRRALWSSTTSGGSFHFDAVTEGRYRAAAVLNSKDIKKRTSRFLAIVQVNGDIEGLVLQPASMSTVKGRLHPIGGAPLPPRGVHFSSHDGFGDRWARVNRADASFEVEDLVPGSYTVRTRSSEVYVKGVRRGSRIASPDGVRLSSGTNRLDVVVAADHARVYGTVRKPQTSAPLPHAGVALDGRSGKNLVQADQQGRFLFEKVIPGEYRICAWADISPEDVDDDTNWEEAGCSNKIVSVDPEAEIEIDLRAAP